jgi:hypothetical protein
MRKRRRKKGNFLILCARNSKSIYWNLLEDNFHHPSIFYFILCFWKFSSKSQDSEKFQEIKSEREMIVIWMIYYFKNWVEIGQDLIAICNRMAINLHS